MAQREYEFVEHSRLTDVKLFVVALSYRNLHMHGDFELCLVLGGQAEVASRQETRTFGPGEFYLLNPNQPHEIGAIGEDRAVILSLQFAPAFCARYYPSIRNLEFDAFDLARQASPSAPAALRGTLLRLAETYLRAEAGFEFEVYAQLNLLFGTMLKHAPWHLLSDEEKRAKTSAVERLDRLLEVIDRRHAQKLFLTELAELEGVSLTHLSHFFTEQLGMPFQQYLAHLRFQQAKSLLERTRMNVTDVCIASGFSDHRYLSREFRRRLGCSPAEYRERIRGNADEDRPRPAGAIERMLGTEESLALVRNAATLPRIPSR